MPTTPAPLPGQLRFDTVLVTPDGRAVIAGRAAPGSRIAVLDGERELITVTADARGEWATLIDHPPLKPGAHDLRLVQRQDGREIARSDRTITVVVPAPTVAAVPTPPAVTATPAAPTVPAAPTTPPLPPSVDVAAAPGASVKSETAPTSAGPLVVSTPGTGGPSTVIQAPGGPDTLARSGKLVLGALDYDEQGNVTVSGQGPPGTTVRVYVDNQPAGDATADAEGRWTVQPKDAVEVGKRTVRVDQLDAGGSVTARLEIPFERLTLVRPGIVTIVRGDNLWNIARSRYGDGLRYTAIYEANKSQIRDPNLIYPGQTFVIPKSP